MVHISLHTHGTFYLFVCAVNVYMYVHFLEIRYQSIKIKSLPLSSKPVWGQTYWPADISASWLQLQGVKNISRSARGSDKTVLGCGIMASHLGSGPTCEKHESAGSRK